MSRVRWISLVLSVAGLAVAAVAVALAGAFVHRWASPAGLLLAVAGAAAVAVLARAWARSRVGMGVVALLWLVPVLVLAQSPIGGDRVVNGDTAGVLFLFGGAVSHALALGMGAEARAGRRVT